MQPLPEYHHPFAKRFGIDFVNVGYGATEIGYVCAALIDESGGEEWTPREFRKGYSRDEMIRAAGQLGLPVVSGRTPIKKGLMGTPCRFHEVAIVNDRDEEVENGEHGQIILRGRVPSVLLDGYLNKPETTAEALRNQWFHTGDVGCKDKDGLVYFVDRRGGFIRVRGENISSFQVEDMINSHPGVAVSAVFPVKAEVGMEDEIVAYVVPAPGPQLAEEELRSWMDREMPKYMRPAHLRFIDALPQTPTNKVEKYKLKEMFLGERKDRAPAGPAGPH
jgi:crotonobetaine/carnitine-CoA ligase